jgi:hypothetical protein
MRVGGWWLAIGGKCRVVVGKFVVVFPSTRIVLFINRQKLGVEHDIFNAPQCINAIIFPHSHLIKFTSIASLDYKFKIYNIEFR